MPTIVRHISYSPISLYSAVMFMDPVEAHAWGLIDEVIEHRPISLVSDAVSSEPPKNAGGGENKGTEEPSPA